MSNEAALFTLAARRVIIKLFCPLCNKKHDFKLIHVGKGGRTEQYQCTTPGCTYSVYFNVR